VICGIDQETEMSTARRDVASLYRELGQRGMNVGASGNVSARVKGGMIITPSGIAGDTVAPKLLVQMALDGRSKSKLRPSSEWEMHAAIYRAAPAAMVVVHTHSPYATALACLGLALPAFHYAVLEFGGPEVRIAPYLTFGTAELAAAAAAAMAGRTAALLANHGMICQGATPRAALLTALRLEALAQQYLVALSAGTPRLLNEAEIEAARIRYLTYGQVANRKDDPK
jgi:L-fuculose-phosphate aldolase